MRANKHVQKEAVAFNVVVQRLIHWDHPPRRNNWSRRFTQGPNMAKKAFNIYAWISSASNRHTDTSSLKTRPRLCRPTALLDGMPDVLSMSGHTRSRHRMTGLWSWGKGRRISSNKKHQFILQQSIIIVSFKNLPLD